ncbi:unnamed protein product [Dracunculus medinensis]|uniref:Ovule protein n=1 Tax=Dracunculus medinensis TaxID=318479 RepID=A0A0N4UE00_DRAME|nr:unnamed protein product [Dracunculus medinensis]
MSQSYPNIQYYETVADIKLYEFTWNCVEVHTRIITLRTRMMKRKHVSRVRMRSRRNSCTYYVRGSLT